VSSGEAVRVVLTVVGEGVGCEHWTVPDHGLPVTLLEALGFARPIRQRVPRCSEHDCRYLGVCERQVIFEEGRDGRAGRKFRLTAEGQAAAADPTRLGAGLANVATLPLAQEVLAALAQGPRTLFELNWALVEPRVGALAAGEEPPALPSRTYLRATLALLAEQAAIELDDTAGIVRLPSQR
jgi:hypothetical protein